MRGRYGLLFSLLIFLIAPLLHAQESRWENLAQIKPGTKIRVFEQSLKTSTGKLVAVSDSGITINTNKTEVIIPREQVYRVEVRGKNRKRNALVGLGVGAGLGLAVGFGARNVINASDRDAFVAGMTAVYAAAGAGIGAALPAGKTVYRAEAPKQAKLQVQTKRE